MIERIEALGFRSLRHVVQDLGGFHLLVGSNGSGKSGFLDVVGFLGDVLRVGPLKAIIGDAGAGVAQRAADPSHLCWMRRGGRFELAVELRLPPERAHGGFQKARYEISVHVGTDGGQVALETEALWLIPSEDSVHEPSGNRAASQGTLFPRIHDPPRNILHEPSSKGRAGWHSVVYRTKEDSGSVVFASEDLSDSNCSPMGFQLGPDRSALANLPEDESRFPAATWVKRMLTEGVLRIVLNAEAMRRPSPPGAAHSYLRDGSNLPWVVESLRALPDRFERWIDHVRTAIPELKTIETIERPEDRHRYLVMHHENGLAAPSWIMSDGTLRLLALTLIAYAEEPQRLYLIEEPENGIHPRAVETIYQSLSSVYDAQVLCASHSPTVLGIAEIDEILCFAKDANGATDIVRGTEHPQLEGWKGAVDLGTLFAAGVLG